MAEKEPKASEAAQTDALDKIRMSKKGQDPYVCVLCVFCVYLSSLFKPSCVTPDVKMKDSSMQYSHSFSFPSGRVASN